MSKSVLYAANTVTQSLAAGGTINFGSIVRRYGCNLALSGGNVTCEGAGYYSINANINFEGSAAGTATIQLYQDGSSISGAEAVVTTAASTDYSVNIPATIRLKCCCDSTITAVVSGTAVDVLSAAIEVVKE